MDAEIKCAYCEKECGEIRSAETIVDSKGYLLIKGGKVKVAYALELGATDDGKYDRMIHPFCDKKCCGNWMKFIQGKKPKKRKVTQKNIEDNLTRDI